MAKKENAVDRYWNEWLNFGGLAYRRYRVYKILKEQGASDGEIDMYFFGNKPLRDDQVAPCEPDSRA